ncbi:ABC transporter permease [Neolewinella aurantiaca]|uniref:ABC transporter permease n=1 Tax=Neolewinella aurantiaca TaxID=2602767 RepID=A0A5C7FL89_9BACT|nr:ABC transporter permease [Neolewinella aurantiaca]TXF91467.1 ABC transporter permease [Neolewinella aurantiaca]
MKKKGWLRKAAITWLIGLFLIAVFADFIANDRPLIAKAEGELRFPVLHEYGSALGLTAPYQPVVRNWKRVDTEWALWPVVPYSAGATDLKNSNFKSPFDAQETGPRARHYLGTDKLGRDVLAGLIAGSRVAIFVGIGSLLISLLIGVPMGGVAGFFGNDGLRGSRARWWGRSVGGLLGVLYAWISLLPYFRVESFGLTVALLITGFIVGGWLLSLLLRLVPFFRKPTSFPADSIFLQVVELFVNIPGLVLLIALLAVINQPSLWIVVLVIGVLRWPYVARHLRAELLRIRSLPYIEAARISGLGKWRILFHHALPNALGPLMIVSAFGLGGAILLEAFLSFLGIGIPTDQVTWGSLLRASRSRPDAWWLAVFPGVLLTFTVLAANILGERN